MRKNAYMPIAQAALLLVAYIVTAKMGLAMDAVSGFATLVWPPSGIALAALLIWHWRLWPIITIAAFIVNYSSGAPLLVALGIAAGNTLEALVAARLLQRRGFQISMRRVKDVVALVLLAGFLSGAISATIGSSSLLVGNVISAAKFFATWKAWWVGDALSLLVITPLIFALATWREDQFVLDRSLETAPKTQLTGMRLIAEAILVIFTTCAVCLLVFGFSEQDEVTASQPYLFFPIAIWVALRFGTKWIAIFTFVISGFAIWATYQGMGPFFKNSIAGSLTILQLFIASLAMTALFLAAAAAERIHASHFAKQVEKRAATEKRISAILHSAYDAFMGMNAQGRITEWNRQAEVTFGWTSTEIIGRLVADVLIPERYRDNYEGNFKNPLASNQSPILNNRSELQALHKDGRELPVEITISVVKDGQADNYGVFLRDITNEKRAQQIQVIQLHLTRILAEGAPIAEVLPRLLQTVCKGLSWDFGDIWMLNKSGTHLEPVSFWHKGTESHQEFESASRQYLFAPTDGLPGRVWPSKAAAWIGDILTDGNFPRAKIATSIGLRSAVAFPILANAELIGVGEFYCQSSMAEDKQIIELMTDIGSRLGLYIQRDLANTANAAKSTFLAHMSHEIRTPLGAVLGFAELLSNSNLPPSERQKYLDAIKRNGDLLSTVINDILDISKVEAGKIQVERQDVKLSEILDDAATLCGLQAQEKGLHLTIRSNDTVPTFIQTDSFRLRQILVNIIGNSVKFTPKGNIEVIVNYEDDEQGLKQLTFSVRDTGIGLTQRQAASLFEPFTQADASIKRRHGGTGLGLALAKRLAQLLGGDVVLVESQPNHGSTFKISIDPGHSEKASFETYNSDERAPASTSQDNAMNIRLEGMSILVVEDAPDNRLLIGQILNLAGVKPDMAENGKEGLEKAKQHSYDAILMDLQMPIMDGFESLLEIRKQGIHTPILALTAHALKEEQRRCFAAGFDGHLSKPINRRVLLTTLSQLSPPK